MPGIYDFGIDRPQSLTQLALQGYEQGHAIKQRNNLQDLMGDYYGQQDPRFGEIARNGGDPSKMIEQQRQMVGEGAAMIAAADPSMRPQMYGEFVRKLPPQLRAQMQAPEVWDERLLPVVQQAAQLWGAGGRSQVPAGYQEFELMTRGMSPEDKEKARRVGLGIDPRAGTQSNIPFGFMEVMGADGRIRVVSTDKRTGAAGPAGSPGSAPANAPGNADAITAAMNFMTQQGIDPAAVEAWGMQQLGGTPAPQAPSGALVSPTPGAIKADEVYGAKGAEFAVDQQRAPFDVQQAAAVAQAKAGAEATAARGAEVEKRRASASRVIDLMERAKPLVLTSTGSGAGAQFDRAQAFVGGSNKGAESIAALRTLAGQAISMMPRMEGPQSDRDAELYRQAAGDLANPDIPRPQRLAAIETIISLQQQYQDAGVASAPGPSAAPADNPRPRLKYNPATGLIE